MHKKVSIGKLKKFNCFEETIVDNEEHSRQYLIESTFGYLYYFASRETQS
jgi:hypothetical protein